MSLIRVTLLLVLSQLASMASMAEDVVCSSDDYVLTSQAQVAALGDEACNIITGSLTIQEGSSGAISDLDALQSLKRIGGNLTIRSNVNLTNLDGLVNIESVGPVALEVPSYYPSGPQQGISTSTVTTGGWRQCYSSYYNSSFQGIPNDCGGGDGAYLMMACYYRYSSNVLTVLAAAPAQAVSKTTSSQTETHEANGSLWYNYPSYSQGFAALGEEILLDPWDQNTDGTNASRLSWRFSGSGYRCGGNNITSSSYLRVIYTNVPAAKGDVVISGNSLLRDLEGLRGLTAILGNLDIQSNGALADVDGLRNIASVSGDVTLQSNQQLVHIDGLLALSEIGGTLNVRENPNLAHVDGLISLSGVGGQLSLGDNASLFDLAGLNNLQRVEDTLIISANPSLTSISDFSSLEFVGGLSLLNNDSVQVISAFPSLTQVLGTLIVGSNDRLEALSGFASLRRIGGLRVDSNQSLAHINGLRTLEAPSGASAELSVYNNYGLLNCKSLAYALGQTEFTTNIYSNAFGCSSRQQILDSIIEPSQPAILDMVLRNREPALQLRPSQTGESLWPVTGYETRCEGITEARAKANGQALLDNTPVQESVYIGSSASIAAIELDLDISHSDPGDLTVALRAPSGTTEVVWDRVSGGEADIAVTLGSGVPAEGNEYSDYYPVGPKTNVPMTTVEQGGWTLCHASRYNYGFNSETLEACAPPSGGSLMLACRATGSDTITLLAAAPTETVLTKTSGQSDTHIGNGTAWYNWPGYSVGFARAGDPVNLYWVDTSTAGANEQRLSWHTNGNDGYRCGEYQGFGSGFERLVFTSQSEAPGFPEALDVFHGEDMRGSWTLTVEDVDVGPIVREGVLNSWALRMKEIVSADAPFANPVTVSDLYKNRSYSCSVAPKTKLGLGPRSDTFSFVAPYLEPAKTTITRVTEDSETISIYFNAPLDDGGRQITGYEATCFSEVAPTVSAQSTGSPIVVRGLVNDTQYVCELRAINAIGPSEPAFTRTVTPEYIPTGLPIWLLYEATRP